MEIEPSRHLYGNSRGVLLAEPLALGVGYIITPQGRLVIGCQADAGDSSPWTLCVPDEAPGAVQVMGEPERIDARTDSAADRWVARHGPLRDLHLFALRIESVRCADRVWDVQELRLQSPIASGEAGILRALNADPAALTAMCERATRVRPERATAVGVDAWGLWIRGAIGAIRVEFGQEIKDVTNAQQAVAELTKGARA